MQIQLTDSNVAGHLRSLGLLGADQEAAVEPAGDGNINWVRRLRLRPCGESMVVKQARPALERFPQYQASTERIVFEARYYESVAGQDPGSICPRVIFFDAEARLLVLEDLGDAERLDHALARGEAVGTAAAALGAFLGRVHAAISTNVDETLASRFANDEMRRLHGDHIFRLPFAEGSAQDFGLTPAVAARAGRAQADRALVAAAAAAYARYLEPHGALVHGDVQAGNVLLAARGPVLLDAEIAHVGDPAFDVGTLLAHLLLPAVAEGAAARRPAAAADAVWAAYVEAHGVTHPGFRDCARYAGLEMMRRTIGAARVSAVAQDEAALRVIDAAERLIRKPPETPAGLL
jgi:5-methylthioribose kinase